MKTTPFTGACVHSIAAYRHLGEVRFRHDDDGSFVLEVGDARVTLGADVAFALYGHLDNLFGGKPADPQQVTADTRQPLTDGAEIEGVPA